MAQDFNVMGHRISDVLLQGMVLCNETNPMKAAWNEDNNIIIVNLGSVQLKRLTINLMSFL